MASGSTDVTNDDISVAMSASTFELGQVRSGKMVQWPGIG